MSYPDFFLQFPKSQPALRLRLALCLPRNITAERYSPGVHYEDKNYALAASKNGSYRSLTVVLFRMTVSCQKPMSDSAASSNISFTVPPPPK